MLTVVGGSWAHRLIGEAELEHCSEMAVEEKGIRALCLDCRDGYRESVLNMGKPERELAALHDEWERQKEEEAEDKFPWSLRKAIEKVFDLELEAMEGIWMVEGDDAKRQVSMGVRPVVEANSKLLDLYRKVTGFEFRTRRDVLGEIAMRSR